MTAVNSALVVGGGAAGSAVAILLAEAGVQVDLIDVKPEPTATRLRNHPAGQCVARAQADSASGTTFGATVYAFETLGLRAPDPAGTVIIEMPDVKTGGPDLPATLGMPRPDLARILTDRAAATGVKLRFGTTFTELAQDDDGVDVTFSDGSAGRYDLVIGADGIRSCDPPRARHPPRDHVGRDGHLARFRPAARERHPHRSDTTAGPATSRATARRVRTRCTPTSSRTPRTAPPCRRTSSWRPARALAGLPRPVGRHPRGR